MAEAILQDRRAIRAEGICERQELMLQDDGSWKVRDTHGSGKWYTVINSTCSCPDAVYRRVTCKHVRAVLTEERDLAQFCDDWNARVEQTRVAAEELPGDFLDGDFSAFDDDVLTGPRCPTCGTPLSTRSYYIGGRGYQYVQVCPADMQHAARAA